MAATRKTPTFKDPYSPLIETWIARLLIRNGLWRQIKLRNCMVTEDITTSVVVRSLVLNITEVFSDRKAKAFLKDGSAPSFRKFVEEFFHCDEEDAREYIKGSRSAGARIRDDDGSEAEIVPPLAQSERGEFLKAFLHDHRQYLESGQILFNQSRVDNLGNFWLKLHGRGTPKALTDWLARLERDYGNTPETRFEKAFPSFLHKNFSVVSEAFLLSPLMVEAIAFLHLAEKSEALQAVLDLDNSCYKTYSQGLDTIACALDVKRSEVEALLADDGPLVASGLILCVTESDRITFDFLEFSGCIPWNRFFERELSEEAIFGDLVRAAPMSELGKKDFRHLPLVESTLLPYLRTALEEKRTGVNVLLYGPPGTGKTELSRLVADELDARLYEIQTDADEGRLNSWRTASVYLKRSGRTLLALDEAEDAFSERMSARKGDSDKFISVSYGKRKGRLHHWLETCPVPTFWITNSIDEIDPATVRRFDIVLEMTGPDMEGRRRFIRDMTALRLTDEAEERLVQTSALTPGVMARVTRVVDTVGPWGGKPSDEMVLSLVSETLRAQRFGDVASGIGILPEVYDPTLITSEIRPDELVKGIEGAGSARLCLYGPPGTGKTAFSMWVARELGRPLLRRTYGDLASCWVGETEQNIAKVFREAKRDKAVLLIDEADSFFRSREMSTRSWETTQVNEMLARLEDFDGVFFATTNLMRDFDEAAMRRFDWKVSFGFLLPEARLTLAKRYAEKFRLPWTKSAEALLATLDKLTPGDYCAVARQARFRPLCDADDLVVRLKAEEEVKTVNGPRNTIGFA